MKRIQGSDGVKVLECANPRLQKWIVRWDIQPVYRTDKRTGEQVQAGVDYFEQWITHKPNIDEVKDIVLSAMNEVIDRQILEGFEWNGMAVWLSSENQFNYKAAFDLAAQTGGMNLPVTFKFGTTQEPVYHEFTTVEELTDFYTKAMSYINGVLAEGWKNKDAMDWSAYEAILNPEEAEG